MWKMFEADMKKQKRKINQRQTGNSWSKVWEEGNQEIETSCEREQTGRLWEGGRAMWKNWDSWELQIKGKGKTQNKKTKIKSKNNWTQRFAKASSKKEIIKETTYDKMLK